MKYSQIALFVKATQVASGSVSETTRQRRLSVSIKQMRREIRILSRASKKNCSKRISRTITGSGAQISSQCTISKARLAQVMGSCSARWTCRMSTALASEKSLESQQLQSVSHASRQRRETAWKLSMRGRTAPVARISAWGRATERNPVFSLIHDKAHWTAHLLWTKPASSTILTAAKTPLFLQKVSLNSNPSTSCKPKS